jgi:hypothetical protein
MSCLVHTRTATAAILFVVATLSAMAQLPQPLETFLRDQVQFTDKELEAAARGKAVAKILPAERNEIAVFGIVLVNARAELYVERFRHIERFKKSTAVPVVRKFSDPLRLDDVRELTVDQDDFNSLKDCRVGSCAVKLPSEIIERLQREINWDAPDAHQRVNRLARAALLEYVKRYQEGGNAELSEYNDKKTPRRVAEEFGAILKASPYVYDYAPEFYAYLREYPRKRLDGVEDFIYWSKEKFGLKPVISVTHVSIYPDPQRKITLIASKQIYASHYFEASLGLTALAPAGQGFYLLYYNRSRADALRGGFSGMVRGKVQGRTRDGALENLEKVKAYLEGGSADR